MTDRQEVVASNDRRLEIRFVWHHDRYLHRIYFDNRLAGYSVEGDSTEIWPPSPPLQQLSLTLVDDRAAVLGMGSAGRSHWSLSAVPCSDQPGAIRFELACRCAGQPEFVGSTYHLEDQVRIAADPDSVRVDREGQVSITAKPSPAGTRPAAASSAGTRQWSYRILVS